MRVTPATTATAARDNCPRTASSGQADLDVDGLGDACDADADDDGDGRLDAADRCAARAGTAASGCPSVTRRLTLAYSAARKRFSGTLTAALDACRARTTVSIYRDRPRADPRVARVRTVATGRFTLRRAAAAGRYHARVAPTAECGAAKSRSATVRRARR